MALNFPTAPTIGQVFVSDGVSFTWSGVVWYATPTLFPPFATEAEAVAGVRADVVMSPLTTLQAKDGFSRVKYYPAVTCAGLTEVAFDTIPDWANELVFVFEEMGTGAAATFLVQLGTAAAWITTGYLGTTQLFGGVATANGTSSAGIPFTSDGTNRVNGCVVLQRIAGRSGWAADGNYRRSATGAGLCAGRTADVTPMTRARILAPAAMNNGFVSMTARE